MSNVLLVCRQNEITKALTEIMRGMEFSMVDAVPSGSEGRRRLQEIEYDMVIINTPLGDEFGIELALDTIEKYLIGVVLIVKNELADQVEAKLMDTTAFVVSKPINRQLSWKQQPMKKNMQKCSTNTSWKMKVWTAKP